LNTLERRLELLKLEGEGFSPTEIVKDLSVKYEVTVRTVYHDFETKHIWQPLISEWDFEEHLLTTVNRYEQLYRKASLLTHDNNPLVRLGAIRTCFQIQKESQEIRHMGYFDRYDHGAKYLQKPTDTEEIIKEVAEESWVPDEPIKAVFIEGNKNERDKGTPQVCETPQDKPCESVGDNHEPVSQKHGA
jgi:hypothetical protein